MHVFMKRITSFVLFMWAMVAVYASIPVDIPQLGNGRLVVCGQNAQNYFAVHFDRTDYNTTEGLEDKTARIVTAFRAIDADIYAICELENNDSILHYLTDAMNAAAEQDIYSYVSDNGVYSSSESIKSGFLYRNDKVRPYGANTSASSSYYYRYTMRLQAFEELSTRERFVLSMNHFKAKDSTADKGNAKRETNASHLVGALRNVNVDPDILVMGDLNCEIDESPLQTIVNEGYVEQLIRYDADAYSYIYKGSRQLIDHVFANESMQKQLTGAGVCHVNTGTSYSGAYHYSDHDPYMVAMNLSSGSAPEPNPNPDGCQPLNFSQDYKSGLGEFSVYTVSGDVSWYSNSSYGAVCNGWNKTGEMESWLISPAFDLQEMETATLSFRHNLYKDNTSGQYEQLQTLWYSIDYVDGTNPNTATWHQLVIPSFVVGSYVNCSVALPDDAVAENFRFAFKYTATDGANANFWEIDNVKLQTVCPLPESVEKVEEPVDIFDVFTRVYTVLGQEVTAQKDNLPEGVYILVNGARRQKILLNAW